MGKQTAAYVFPRSLATARARAVSSWLFNFSGVSAKLFKFDWELIISTSQVKLVAIATLN